MRFSVSDDVALPRERVFARMSDFDRLVAGGRTRGAQVERSDPPGPIKVGSCWKAEVLFHGVRRPVSAEVSQLNPPEGFVVSGSADGVTLYLELSLEEIDLNTTHVRLIAEVKPRTMTGRVLIKTARLMKSTLETRFKDRVRGYLQRIESEPDGAS